MTPERRPQTIRKSLLLAIMVIGGFMVVVGVASAIAKKDTNAYRAVSSGTGLILIAGALYLRRTREEKKLKVDSQV